MDKNDLLLIELERYLKSKYTNVERETFYFNIMPTKRRYQIDYFMSNEKIILEVNGGQWTKGRHTRAGKVKGKVYTQYENDLTKINLAQYHGFKYYQFTYEMLMRQEYKLYL